MVDSSHDLNFLEDVCSLESNKDGVSESHIQSGAQKGAIGRYKERKLRSEGGRGEGEKSDAKQSPYLRHLRPLLELRIQMLISFL